TLVSMASATLQSASSTSFQPPPKPSRADVNLAPLSAMTRPGTSPVVPPGRRRARRPTRPSLLAFLALFFRPSRDAGPSTAEGATGPCSAGGLAAPFFFSASAGASTSSSGGGGGPGDSPSMGVASSSSQRSR